MSALAEHTRSKLTPFDSFHTDFLANPHSFFATRRESDPAHRGTPPSPRPGPGSQGVLLVRGLPLVTPGSGLGVLPGRREGRVTQDRAIAE